MADTHPHSSRSAPSHHARRREARARRRRRRADRGQRRADDARYQEVRCRSALNPVKGMPFHWTLNPYRGCTHGCHYCFARRYHAQFELGADDEFASVILVKTNCVDVLRRELRPILLDPRARGARHRHRSLPADRGPLQAHAAVARGALRVGDAGGHRHKGPDGRARHRRPDRRRTRRRLHGVHQRALAWTRTHGGASSRAPRRRCSACRAVRALADAGVRAGVLMAPIVPGITTTSRVVEATITADRRPRARSSSAQRVVPRGRHARRTSSSFSAANTRSSSTATTSCMRAAPRTRSRKYATEVQGMVRALRAR